MKFIDNFYIFFVFSFERIWKANCSADLKIAELEHLSERLDPTECIRLLEAMHPGKPEYKMEGMQSEDPESHTNQNCRVKLEEWNRSFPGEDNERARVSMETILRETLGRPDLANYIKRSRRLVEILNKLAMSKGEQQRGKYLLRRHAAKSFPPHPKKNKKTKDKKSLLSSSVARPPSHVRLDSFSPSEVNSNHDVKKHEFSDEKLQQRKEVTFQNIPQNQSGKKENSVSAGKNIVPDPDDTGWTRWIAIIIFILLIISTMITTAFIAIYKNRCRLLGDSGKPGKRVCDDRCPLTDNFRGSSDIEYGWSASSTDYTASRWRRESSIPSSSSPIRSLFCLKDNKEPTKPAKKVKRVVNKRQQTPKFEKKRKSKDNKVKVKKKRKVSIDKKKDKVAELSFREKIANILRKDKADCKCCQCAFGNDDEKHRICSDDHCKQRRILNLTELYSPRSKDTKKSKKMSKKKTKKEEYDEGNEEIISPVSSPRSRKESSRSKEKSKTKEKSPRWSLNEPCTRETCEMRRSPRDRNSMDISLKY